MYGMSDVLECLILHKLQSPAVVVIKMISCVVNGKTVSYNIKFFLTLKSDTIVA